MRDRAHIIMLLTAPFGEAATRAVDARLHLIAGFTFVTNNRTLPRAGLPPHVTDGEQRRKARVAGRYSGGILSRRGIIAACDRAASRAAPPRPRPRPRPRRPFPRPRAAGLRARGRGGPRARTRLRPCPASSSSPSLASREGAKPGPIRKPLALYLTECLLLMVCALRP